MQRFLIAMYAIWWNLINRISSRHGQEGQVLILFQQVFGDAVVLTSALQGYVDLFVKKQGYRVTLLCKSAVAKFLEEVASIPEEINVETIDFKRSFDDFGYFKEISRKYRYYANLVVVPGSSMSAELLSTTLKAQRRIGMTNVFSRKWPPQLVIFERLAYSEPVVPKMGMMMIQRHRLLLNYLGFVDFKGKLPCLKSQIKMIRGDYIVICPGASTSVKRWPIERFAQLADKLIELYKCDIYLCGGNDEEKDANRLLSLSKFPYRISSRVGMTSFWEWSAIVQHAMMVIGNDSATLHIAAAHRVKAICIAGVYDKFQFFPYIVDELDEGDRLPETVYMDMPCEYCRTKGYFAGYGNPKCRHAIKAGKCSLCIDAISIRDVMERIEIIT